jgi:hypothetical protein
MRLEDIPTTTQYLIVGGGTGGLVVACRLSEDPDNYIVVLESGPDASEDGRIRDPLLWRSWSGSELDWKLKIAPQVRCVGLPNLISIAHMNLPLDWVQWPRGGPSRWESFGWLLCDQWLGIHPAITGWNRCMGEIGKSGLELGDFATLSPEIVYPEWTEVNSVIKLGRAGSWTNPSHFSYFGRH